MKLLSVVGTAAMFMVGGGILVHGVPALHHFVDSAAAGAGSVAGSVRAPIRHAGGNRWDRRHRRRRGTLVVVTLNALAQAALTKTGSGPPDLTPALGPLRRAGLFKRKTVSEGVVGDRPHAPTSKLTRN
jgi:hypothetical protein